MEWYRIRSKVLQISLQLLFLSLPVLCQPSIRIDPISTTSLEGGNVTLYCVIDNMEANYDVQWIRGEIPISRDATILVPEPRLSVEMDSSRGEYNLMINHVTLGDDTTYSCRVMDKDDITTPVDESDEVRLEVHHVPPSKYPSCFPLTKDSYQVGEEITITCQSERGNPPVNLMWTHEGNPLPIHTDDTQNGFRGIDYTFTVRHENHGNIFQCKLTTSATNLVHRSCSLGPLEVTFPPTATRIEGPDSVAADQEIELSCNSEANPPPSYIWTFSQKIDQTRVTYSDDNKQISFTAALADDGLIIGCNATNDFGTERDAIILSVNPALTKPIYGTTPSREMTPDDGSDTGGAPSKPQTEPSNNIILKPEVLAIIASTLTLIVLVLIVLVVVTCRCRPQNPKTVTQMPQMIYGQYGPSSIQGWEQGSIYFEPRDRISVRDMPTWQRPAPWHRNVAVQVPWVEEPPYEEIGQNWDEGMTLEI